MLSKFELLQRRKYRSRKNLKTGMKNPLPRLSVFRSNLHTYAQIIDDGRSLTLAAASTNDLSLRSKIQKGWDVKAAEAVGAAIAQRAKEAGITAVVFDRGPYVYHGRVKALALAARAGGLQF